MTLDELLGGPFDTVFDIGGNVGDFAELARKQWPAATITSFEPLPKVAAANRRRAERRWWVENVAISHDHGTAEIGFCVNQHSASTMQKPGGVRRELFGIRDRFEQVQVRTAPLDAYIGLTAPDRRLLVKIDVEGHEGSVMIGAPRVLAVADTVIVEVQQDPDIFLGSPDPHQVDNFLGGYGLRFAGVLDAFKAPDGRVLQFDGVWRRP